MMAYKHDERASQRRQPPNQPVTNGEDADFDISVMEESEVKKVCDQNKYAKELADGCYLSLLQENKTKNAFKKDK
jgi:hypothetical protein